MGNPSPASSDDPKSPLKSAAPRKPGPSAVHEICGLRQRAKSALNEKFSNSMGVIFDKTVQSDNYWTYQHEADDARNIGFIIVIAGVAVLLLARNATAMDSLVKRQMNR
jgi:hypothetical protein